MGQLRSLFLRRPVFWSVLGGLTLLMALGSFRYRLVIIVGNSMSPTLRTGELVVVDRRAYLLAAPAENEIALAEDRGALIVKRVVGLPGQSVEVRNGVVYVDGSRRPPPAGPVTMGPDLRGGVLGLDRFALLGDNRDMNHDRLSSQHLVNRGDFRGRLVLRLRWWPPSVARLDRPL